MSLSMPYSLRNFSSVRCGWCAANFCNCEDSYGPAPRGGICPHGEAASNCDRGGCDEW